MKGGHVAIWTGVALAISGLAAAGWFGGYRINLTPSAPLGLWRIEPVKRHPQIGDLIFICPPTTGMFEQALARGYLRVGLCPGAMAPLIKTVRGLGGQYIEVRRDVVIDGTTLVASTIRDEDASGRVLVAFGGGVVAPGDVFVHSAMADSYDSRYFGPIPATGLLGLAVPVFTVNP